MKLAAYALLLSIVSVGSAYAAGDSQTCYSSVQSIPVTCGSGNITQDVWNGCRQITCTNGASSTQALACDKPSSNAGQYFEVYKQAQTGTPINVCFGSTCINNNGYVRSANFPYCVSTPPPQNTSTNSTNQTSCYSAVKDAPATCTGSITSDSMSGTCRTITCSNGSDSVNMQACEKTDATGTFFEMYRQSSTGTQPQVCLGTDCLKSGWGYQKGSYFPVCTATNATNQTAAQVFLMPYVSQDHNALFYCNTSFTPTQFNWNFGDGKSSVKNNSTSTSGYWNYYYHTYLNNGTYTVTCNATNGTQTAQGQLAVVIRTNATAAEINATLPSQDTDYWNPYVFRPISQLINGSKYRVGGYAIGLPRNVDSSGQSNDWQVSGSFYGNYIGVNSNILSITFPQPGNYSFGSDPGINDYQLAPELYTSGMETRGCSSMFVTCMDSVGSTTVNVPDLGTRTYYGITATQTGPLTYRISCDNYASDQGLSARIDTGDSAYVRYTPGQATTYTYRQPGTYQLTCYQDLLGDDGIDYEYRYSLVVTNSTPQNISTTLTIAPNYPQGNNYIFDCNANGFTPTLYDYTFGDGQSWSNVTFNNTFHSYQNGNYNVTCTAKNSQVSATGKLNISVGSPSQTCYNSVQNIPASCTGGTITSDTTNGGCRTIVCSANGDSMQVLACDKTNPAHVEMYKQSQTGTRVTSICLASTCISNNGFASANYPVCSS